VREVGYTFGVAIVEDTPPVARPVHRAHEDSRRPCMWAVKAIAIEEKVED
jgi:hypothetical protein